MIFYWIKVTPFKSIVLLVYTEQYLRYMLEFKVNIKSAKNMYTEKNDTGNSYHREII